MMSVIVRVCCVVTIFVKLFDTSMAFNLTILHTNDVHDRYDQINKYGGACSNAEVQAGECFGGMARLSTKVNELRATRGNTVLVDGGDQYQGTVWFFKYGGNVTVHFMNVIGYDVMALGNHEFDRGPTGLDILMENAKFPILSSNINASRHPVLAQHLLARTILTIGGEKIGFVGYTTPETTTISNPGMVTFSDEIVSVRREVENLQKENVNKIVAVGHSGYTKDLQIAREVKGIDVVVGGHTNTFLYNGVPPSIEEPVDVYPTVVQQADGARVLVVQDYTFAKYLGVLEVQFDDTGAVTAWAGNPIILDKTVPENDTVLQDLAIWRAGVAELANQTIGRTEAFLEGDRIYCRKEECNLGNLITDSMVVQNIRHSNSSSWNDVAIAIYNSGGIRSSIEKGNITVMDILAVQPFRNTIDLVELNGTTLRAVFEYSAAIWNPQGEAGGFLQVSGVIVEYDLKKPKGQRVRKLRVRCADCELPAYVSVQPVKVYKIIMPSFLADGGDGFSVIKDNILARHLNGDLDSDVLIKYVSKFSPIFPGLEERIRFYNESDVQCEILESTSGSWTNSNSSWFLISLLAVIQLFMWK